MTTKGLLIAAVLFFAASGAYASDAVLSDSELAGVFAGQNNEYGLSALVGDIDAEYTAAGEQVNVAAVIGTYALEDTLIENTNFADIENIVGDSVFLNQLNIAVIVDKYEVDLNGTGTHVYSIDNSNDAILNNEYADVNCGFCKEDSEASYDGLNVVRGDICGEKSAIGLQTNIAVVYTEAPGSTNISNTNTMTILNSGLLPIL